MSTPDPIPHVLQDALTEHGAEEPETPQWQYIIGRLTDAGYSIVPTAGWDDLNNQVMFFQAGEEYVTGWDHGLAAGVAALEAERGQTADALMLAWGVIANAHDGDWSQASPEWREAAERWRDEVFHPNLDRIEAQR